MHFHVKMPENGRKNIFTDKQTRNKVPLMFLDVQAITERCELRFWTVSKTRQGTVYVFSV